MVSLSYNDGKFYDLLRIKQVTFAF